MSRSTEKLIEEARCWAEGHSKYTGYAEVSGLLARMAHELERLNDLINTPELKNFVAGAFNEAIHQRERWGAEHDAGKSAFDWFWLIGFLAQKAAEAEVQGDLAKAQHHTISTAAALANWHAALAGYDKSMRPGIAPPAGFQGSGSAEQ